MSDENVLFLRGRNKGNERRATIKAPQGMVSRKPTKEKRIKFRIEITLTGGKTGGLSSWLEADLSFVAEHKQTVTEDKKFEGVTVNLDDNSLFTKPVVATSCKIRGIVVDTQGASDDPEVVLHFLVYTAYTDKLWRWIGGLMGEEVWARFDHLLPSEETKQDLKQLELTSDEPAADDPDPDKEGEDDIAAYEKKAAAQARRAKGSGKPS